MEFLSEVVMGKIMKGGKVVLLLSGRLVQLLAVFFFVPFLVRSLCRNSNRSVYACAVCVTQLLYIRYAGRKAVIVKPSDEGTSDKPFR